MASIYCKGLEPFGSRPCPASPEANGRLTTHQGVRWHCIKYTMRRKGGGEKSREHHRDEIHLRIQDERRGAARGGDGGREPRRRVCGAAGAWDKGDQGCRRRRIQGEWRGEARKDRDDNRLEHYSRIASRSLLCALCVLCGKKNLRSSNHIYPAPSDLRRPGYHGGVGARRLRGGSTSARRRRCRSTSVPAAS